MVICVDIEKSIVECFNMTSISHENRRRSTEVRDKGPLSHAVSAQLSRWLTICISSFHLLRLSDPTLINAVYYIRLIGRKRLT
jgi:hypothetical protein